MQSTQPLHSTIPANKFYPPRIPSRQILQRNELLAKLLARFKQYQYLVIKARAGQGKTIFALQLLEESKEPFLWYQVGREDEDPLFFISALASALKQTVPRFHSASLESLLSSGGASVADLPAMTNLLLTALAPPRCSQLTIVFDDIYFIDGAEQTLSVLGHILNTLPPSVSCILISRNEIPIPSKRLKFGNSTFHVNNEDLALTLDETARLVDKLQDTSVSPDIIRKIHTLTDGWPMGIVLKSHLIHQKSSSHVNEICSDLIVYFEEELFWQFDKKLQQCLLLLSLLDTMPLELAERITECEDIGQSLKSLFATNCFIRSNNQEETLFSFHHLFHSFLRDKAKKLPQKTQKKILRSAGSYYLEKGYPEKSLSFFLAAGEYSKMNSIVQRHGMAFMKRNRQFLLQETLAAVPAKQLADYPYLNFYYGLVLFSRNAETALSLLVTSRKLFKKNKDRAGELLALSQIIYLYIAHLMVSVKGAQYLDDASTLFAQSNEQLPDTVRAFVAKNIGWGFIYLRNDIKQGVFFADNAEAAAIRSGELGLQFETKILQGFIHLFSGDFKKFNGATDWLYEMFKKQELSTHLKVLCYYAQLQILHTQNDSISYRQLKEELTGSVDEQVLKKTVIHPFLVIYDIDFAIAEDNFELAEEIVQNNISSAYFLQSRQLRIEILALYALILAHRGRFAEKGQAMAEEAKKLMSQGTIPLAKMKATVLLGSAYGRAGDYAQALSLFDALDTQEDQVPLLIRLWCLMHRAWLMQKKNRISEALGALSFSLAKMEQNGFTHIRALTPAMFRKLLELAVSHNISQNFARDLARNHLHYSLISAGDSMPLLQIQCLGNLSLSINNREIAQASDFTPSQRQLLGLIVSRPKLQISQELAQTTLWPDIPPEKARKRFDTQLSRLRSMLRLKIAPHHVKQYLQLSKGILLLQNCSVDAHEFDALIQQGRNLAAREHWFQAGIKFRQAMSIWKGVFAADLFNCDQADSYGMELLTRYTDTAVYWASAIIKMGRQSEAIEILQEAWTSDTTNGQIVHLLYKSQMQSGNRILAHQILEQFEKELHRREYPADEIPSLVEEIADK